MKKPQSSFLFVFILLMLTIGCIQAQQGLKAEYYDGINFDRFVTTKHVHNIDEYWNDRPPVHGVDPHHCSIRWTGKLKPGKSGNYKFSARVDDGIRVWIDHKLIIDQWGLNDVGLFQSTMYLMANEMYNIKIEYFNALIEGEVRLLWKIPTTEKSWYEYIFGEDKSHTVIAPEYFFLPDPEEPVRKEEKVVAVVAEQEEAVNIAPKKKTVVNKPKKKEPVNPAPPPVKTENPEPAKVTTKEAEKFIPKNIAFQRAEAIMLESSVEELNIFAQFMLDHPEITVMIEGHTDPVGGAENNLKLSKQRAYKVANFLVKKGVDRKRIKAEGYGGTRPLVVPKKGTYYPANRRVVFILDGLE